MAPNATVTFQYGTGQRLSQITNQNGKNTSFTYDQDRQLLTLVDDGGATLTTNTFNSTGRVTAQDDARSGNQQLAFSYAKQGMSGAPVVARNYTVQDFVFLLGYSICRVSSITGLDGQPVAYSFDANGRVVSVTKNSQTTTIGYDANGNVNSRHRPHQPDYDGNSQRIVTATDRTGQSSVVIDSTQTHILSVSKIPSPRDDLCLRYAGQHDFGPDALNHTTSFTYDTQGNLLTSTDAAGKVTTFTYDARNNLLIDDRPGQQNHHAHLRHEQQSPHLRRRAESYDDVGLTIRTRCHLP